MKRPWSELCATQQFAATFYRFARALSLKDSYRARATCDAHVFGQDRPG